MVSNVEISQAEKPLASLLAKASLSRGSSTSLVISRSESLALLLLPSLPLYPDYQPPYAAVTRHCLRR